MRDDYLIWIHENAVRPYIEGFYEAEDDHNRALYGAYIIGILEAHIDAVASVNLAERKEE